jgi:hypothetical protein
MVLHQSRSTNLQVNGRFISRFVRAPNQHDSENESSLVNSYLNVGDAVVVSSEQQHFSLAIGFVRKITSVYVELTLDRAIVGTPAKGADFDSEFNQCFQKLSTTDCDDQIQCTYRIDKDEMSTGLGLLRANIVQLFTADGDERLRKLIVDLEAPQFVASKALKFSKNNTLNVDQKQAIQKVLSGYM